MRRIGLLSDTHGYIHPELPRIFSTCDEIWHAGDFGNLSTARGLQEIKPLRGVFGNIDGQDIRSSFPKYQRFQCEEVDVLMTHIGGYPGNYNPDIREILKTNPPKLFISGHSHILKVMYDKRNQLLHINPGAAGKNGLHKVITMVRFSIDGSQIKDLEVVEFDR
jgi:uncharacterized protein